MGRTLDGGKESSTLSTVYDMAWRIMAAAAVVGAAPFMLYRTFPGTRGFPKRSSYGQVNFSASMGEDELCDPKRVALAGLICSSPHLFFCFGKRYGCDAGLIVT